MSRKRTLRRKLFFNATSHLIILKFSFFRLSDQLLSLYLQVFQLWFVVPVLDRAAVCVYVSVRHDNPPPGFSMS